MSLTNCPKCGGQISDTTSKCVHCGYIFKKCPECGAALAQEEEKCSKCGYRFHARGWEAAEGAPAKNKNFYEKWVDAGNYSDFLKTDSKLNKRIRIIATIFSVFFFILLMFLFVYFANTQSDLEKVINFEKMVGWVNVVIILSLISVEFEGIGIRGELQNLLRVLSCLKWLKGQSFDPIEDLAACNRAADDAKKAGAEFSSGKSYDELAKLYIYLNAFPARKNLYIFLKSVDLLLSVIGSILLDVWVVTQLVPMLCGYFWLHTELAFGAINYGCLIASVLVTLLSLIAPLAMIFERKGRKWVDEELKKREK